MPIGMARRPGVEPDQRGFGIHAPSEGRRKLERFGVTYRNRTGLPWATSTCLNHSAKATPKRSSTGNGLGRWDRTTDLAGPRRALYH